MRRHLTLNSTDEVNVGVSAGEPRVALQVIDNVSMDESDASVWLTPHEARMLAAALVDQADEIDHVDPETDDA